MRTTTFAICGALAALSLGCAAPALAQDHSTPTEIRQTDNLNAQSLAYANAGENPGSFDANRSASTDQGTTINPSPDATASPNGSAKPQAKPDNADTPMK